MRIDVDEGSTRDPDEVGRIDRDGRWFVVFRSPEQVVPGEDYYVAHGISDKAAAEEVAAALVAKYPDRAVYAVGFDRADEPTRARVILHGPDHDDWPGPTGDETSKAVEAAARQAGYYRRQEEKGRAAMVRAEAATVPPPLPRAELLKDHLYANKAAFPDATGDAGTTAAPEPAAADAPAALHTADGRRLADTPAPGEGGAP